jgi:carbamoyltransferase
MNVLGISCFYHDAAACLIKDGRLVAAAEEERFTRRKHDASFPLNAISFCLREGRIEQGRLDGVAFYEKPVRKLERALTIAKRYENESTPLLGEELRLFLHEGWTVERRIRQALDHQGPVFFSEHHLSHAASAFFASPFADAAVLTVDGVGEWATTSQFVGSGRDLVLKREIDYPHSLGMFYATLTAFLGFEVNEGEYKVMGLASCGTPSFADKIEQVLELRADGSFANRLDYFAYMHSRDAMFSPRLVELLGPPRQPDEPVTRRHMDIAASAQQLTERAIVHLGRSLRDHTDSPNLAMAGGVAHNVVANARLRDSGIFENIFVQPSAGDSGGAIGAAWYAACHGLGAERTVAAAYDTCLGPRYGEEEIERVLDAHQLTYLRLDGDALAERVARLIFDDMIVGWFQDRMEFGPRALGNRSLLANPCNPRMKDILNARVKRRERFRPFAPAVLEERAGDFFELDRPSPFMLQTWQVRPDKRSVIPAVTHADGSARVQTVSAARNPRFHRVIEAFARLSGVPMVVNTSFNMRGEPIVCSPEDAVRCFEATDIDVLAIGDFLVEKPW